MLMFTLKLSCHIYLSCITGKIVVFLVFHRTECPGRHLFAQRKPGQRALSFAGDPHQTRRELCYLVNGSAVDGPHGTTQL